MNAEVSGTGVSGTGMSLRMLALASSYFMLLTILTPSFPSNNSTVNKYSDNW